MKRLPILVILVLITLDNFCQVQQLATKADTLQLLQSAHKFADAVNLKDVRKIREMSLTLVHCRLCIENPIPPKTSEYFYIKLNTFLGAAYREPELIKLWTVVKDRNEMINSYMLKKPFRQEALKGLDEVTIFEVFYTTFKPNELANGHEGQQTALQFVKLGRDFKFYGIDTVP
jgi:hypothetical protein